MLTAVDSLAQGFSGREVLENLLLRLPEVPVPEPLVPAAPSHVEAPGDVHVMEGTSTEVRMPSPSEKLLHQCLDGNQSSMHCVIGACPGKQIAGARNCLTLP